MTRALTNYAIAPQQDGTAEMLILALTLKKINHGKHY